MVAGRGFAEAYDRDASSGGGESRLLSRGWEFGGDVWFLTFNDIGAFGVRLAYDLRTGSVATGSARVASTSGLPMGETTTTGETAASGSPVEVEEKDLNLSFAGVAATVGSHERAVMLLLQ